MLGFERQPVRVRVYILLVFLGAVLQTLLFVRDPVPPTVPVEQVPFLIVLFSLLALYSEIKPISTPAGDRKTITASISLTALLLVGPELATLIVGVSQIGCRFILRDPFPKALFNICQKMLTAGVSGTVYLWLLARIGLTPDLTFSTLPSVLSLFVLTLLYYWVNSTLVAIVLALSQNRTVVQQYRAANVELVNGVFLAEAALAVMAAMLWNVTPWSILLAAFVVVVIYLGHSLTASLQIAQRDLLDTISELRRRTAELELLNGVNAALTRALDLNELWEMLAEQVGRILDTTCFFVALVDEETSQLQIAFGQDEGTRSAGRVIPAGAGLSGWVVDHAQPLLIHDYAQEVESFPRLVTWGNGRVPDSVLAVPMILEGRVLGVISAQTYRPNAYTLNDLHLLTAISSQAAVAVNSARLRRAAAEAQALKQLNELKTQFISTVHHELRSPLTPIVGYSEMLTMGGFSERDVQEMAGEINRSALHLQRLVEDILDLSRIESGQLKLSIQPANLAQIVEESVRDFANASDRHDVRCEIPGGPPTVDADPIRMKQVLHNLIANAIKYSPDGGSIVVRVGWADDEVRVSVADQGGGIPPDKIGRLFEMFYRVDNDITRRVRGTGIGLALCKHIVDSHAGKIWVESQVGKGSTFYFSLPVGSGSANGFPRASDSAPPAVGTATSLEPSADNHPG